MLNEKQQLAFRLSQEKKNILVTGKAGTGKSFFIEYLCQHSKMKVDVTATTGIAAVNIAGSTIHSFCGIGLAEGSASQVYKEMSWKGKNNIYNCELLIIDEVSMMSGELFEKLDYIFRKVRGDESPFGGVTLVLCGDFLQLPPVVKGDEEFEYCFEKNSFEYCDFTTIVFDQVYRQSDQKFVSILDEVREGRVSDEACKIIQSCVYDKEKVPEHIKPAILLSHNATCEAVNRKSYNSIKSDEMKFNAKSKFEDDGIRHFNEQQLKMKVAKYFKLTRLEFEIRLKVGAQVMLKSNHLAEEYGVANGSIGTVQSFSDSGLPTVEFDNGEVVVVSYFKFDIQERIDGQKVTLASIMQIPLVYAWAITIHKSQGMTLPYVYIDFENIFAPAQAYVALSRAKSLEGLFTKNFDKDKVFTCERSLAFYKNSINH